MDYIRENIDKIHFENLNILFLFGLALFGGTIGGRIFSKLKIPQVVGYIIIGIAIGQTGLGIIDASVITKLEPFSYFALGLIGFMIGGELKKEIFKKYGKQFMYILFFEGFTAFLIVFILVFIAGYFLLDDLNITISLALLLGAIASATAPAATTDVLWEYKSKGPLTTAVLGIVALDDAFSLLLFAIASSIAGVLVGSGADGNSLLYSIFHPILDITISISLGISGGLILSKSLKKYKEEDKILALSIGLILLVLGLSIAFNLDMLIAAMSMGAVVINFTPKKSEEIFTLVGKFTPPIYVLFFVFVGAKLNLESMTSFMFILAILYLIGRTAGKMLGANFGARISHAPITVQKYLPFTLFSQAGVAIGLSILAGQRFEGEVGNAIIIVITATTFIVQLIGPSFVKFAITKAKEVGLDISVDDVLKEIKINEALDSKAQFIHEDTPLNEIYKIFSESEYLNFPVVDDKDILVGIITIDIVKNIFESREVTQFLLAADIMEPFSNTLDNHMHLFEVKQILDNERIDFLPVTDSNTGICEGVVSRRIIQMITSKKIQEMSEKLKKMEE